MGNGTISQTGVPFNDAYRYVDWLLTVPLLLMELILVMNLEPEETRDNCIKLGSAAALMIVLSWCTYPIVYILPMMGVSGAAARTGIQMGYSIADVIAKPLLGLMVWQIAKRKSKGGNR